MQINIIHNEDCRLTMEQNIDENSVDIVLTSPPYCTSNRAGKGSKVTLQTSNAKYYPSLRYDVFLDNMTSEEYIKWTVGLFRLFDRILKKNGCILYNISYSSDNRDTMFRVISHITEETCFGVADMIGWKKKTALPNNTSSNKLTRIFEPVFVFARKNEIDTFSCNKKVVSVRERTGQKMYENVYNFIEAANNDGVCKLNRATYSSELCEKLLNLYGKCGMTVYDPFMGTGTTAVACRRLSMNYIGSEISKGQIEYASNRISSCLDEHSKKKSAKKSDKRKKDIKTFVQMELFDDSDFVERPVDDVVISENDCDDENKSVSTEGNFANELTNSNSCDLISKELESEICEHDVNTNSGVFANGHSSQDDIDFELSSL